MNQGRGPRCETISVPTTGLVTDLSRINDQLLALYQRTAGAEAGEVSVARALLVNLIAYATTASDAEDAAGTVAEVSGSHPCRALVVEDTPVGPDEPPAVVSVVCGITPRGDRRLCGEIVRLHIHDNATAVTGSVLPLLVPDVPVVTWTTGGLPEPGSEIVDLLRVTDRLVFDSGRVPDLLQAFEYALSFCRPGASTCSVQDLQWIAMEPWRELAARHFDPPAARPYLRGVRTVTIGFAQRGPAVSSAALLWAGWFASRTGIQVQRAHRDGSDSVISGVQDGYPVEIRLQPVESADDGLVCVEIACDHDGKAATFTTRSLSGDCLFASEDCVDLCLPPQQVELPSQTPAALMARALDAYERDMLFSDSLAAAAGILRMLAEADL